MPRRAAAFGLFAFLAVAGAGAGPGDPWAPRATLDPWPTIARFQSWGIGPQPEPDWRAAAVHPHPLVRAAAAAALGRTPERARRPLLDPFLRDRVAVVRRSAQWALFQLEEDVPVALVEDALFIQFPIDRHPTSIDVGLHGLLRRRLPAHYHGLRDYAARRAWLSTQEVLRPPLASASPFPTVDLRGSVAVARSEFDAGEVADLSVRLALGPARSPTTLGFEIVLVPSDPYRPRTVERRPPRSEVDAAVRLPGRVVGGDGTARFALAPGASAHARVAFDLGDLPPDVYTLHIGNPLFLRVRRNAAMEARGAAAVRDVLASSEALEDVARLRVLAAAPALRRRFSESLAAHGFGFNAYRDALVLARMHDPESAVLVAPALLASRGFRDPWTGGDALEEILADGFGGAARETLLRVAADWRKELAAGRVQGVAFVLGDLQRAEPVVERARLEALAELPRSLLRDEDGIAPGAFGLLHHVVGVTSAGHPAETTAALAAVVGIHGFPTLLRTAIEPLTVGQAARVLRPLANDLRKKGLAASPAAQAVANEAAARGITLGAPPP